MPQRLVPVPLRGGRSRVSPLGGRWAAPSCERLPCRVVSGGSAVLTRSARAAGKCVHGKNLGLTAVNAGAPSVPRPAGRLAARAIVRADDTITYTEDTLAALFLEENGL